VRALLQKGVGAFLLEARKFPTIVYKWFRNVPVLASTFWVPPVKAAVTLSKRHITERWEGIFSFTSPVLSPWTGGSQRGEPQPGPGSTVVPGEGAFSQAPAPGVMCLWNYS